MQDTKSWNETLGLESGSTYPCIFCKLANHSLHNDTISLEQSAKYYRDDANLKAGLKTRTDAIIAGDEKKASYAATFGVKEQSLFTYLVCRYNNPAFHITDGMTGIIRIAREHGIQHALGLQKGFGDESFEQIAVLEREIAELDAEILMIKTVYETFKTRPDDPIFLLQVTLDHAAILL